MLCQADGRTRCVVPTATPSGGRLATGIVVPGLGFTLSHRSEIFYLDPMHVNGLQPGKRPRTTLVCFYAFEQGKPWMTFGCPGSSHPHAYAPGQLNVD